MPFHNELNAAKTAALAAGQYLAENRESVQEQRKAGSRDVKLKADQESETIILGILSRLAPHPVLAEESGASNDLDQDRPVWIVDPLDGTVNYSKGLDLCCVSIALYRGLSPLLGVVYDFTRKEMFSAMQGGEAACNGKAIQPSKIADPSQAILATGFPVNRDFGSAPLQAFLHHVQGFKKIRLLGSAALSLAYTACGRVDAYMEEDIMLYDVAAGLAIAQVAGSPITLTPTNTRPWSMLVKAGHVWD
ncbi:inositol monophosphatase family protein [Desulfonatronum parangueonense]